MEFQGLHSLHERVKNTKTHDGKKGSRRHLKGE